tara:strand:- start:2041 stop:2970 length:930 start_codon:yes stop_codon:yes gene_type:complete
VNDRLLEPTTRALGAMHRHQVHRDPWPAFDAFEPAVYPLELRRRAAWHWMARARAEHGSVHQFSGLVHTLARACGPLELQGALARLITDEVRHVELCAGAARAFYPEGDEAFFAWKPPRAPWADAPGPEATREALLGWVSRAILTACCIGETLSRPMLEAVATVATDALPRSCAEQILRDEQLHARFGWEALTVLLPELGDAEREALQGWLARSLAGFERTTCGAVRIEDLAGSAMTIEPGDPERPNLGTLTEEQFAMIFYATLEHEIFPAFGELGLDAQAAWRERFAYPAPGKRPDPSAESRSAAPKG